MFVTFEFGSADHSHEAFTCAAVTFVPSDHTAAGFTFIVHTVLSAFGVMDAANRGLKLKSTSGYSGVMNSLAATAWPPQRTLHGASGSCEPNPAQATFSTCLSALAASAGRPGVVEPGAVVAAGAVVPAGTGALVGVAAAGAVVAAGALVGAGVALGPQATITASTATTSSAVRAFNKLGTNLLL